MVYFVSSIKKINKILNEIENTIKNENNYIYYKIMFKTPFSYFYNIYIKPYSVNTTIIINLLYNVLMIKITGKTKTYIISKKLIPKIYDKIDNLITLLQQKYDQLVKKTIKQYLQNKGFKNIQFDYDEIIEYDNEIIHYGSPENIVVCFYDQNNKPQSLTIKYIIIQDLSEIYFEEAFQKDEILYHLRSKL